MKVNSKYLSVSALILMLLAGLSVQRVAALDGHAAYGSAAAAPVTPKAGR